jgi:hypothetical protein
MPGTVHIVAVVLLAFGAMVALAMRLFDASNSPVVDGGWAAYEACGSLLTEGERSFFGVLDQALAGEYRLFAKVRLADVVRPVHGPSRSGRQAAFNSISAKHVDFVLCDPASLRVVGVVELDDKSHRRLDRGLRDGVVGRGGHSDHKVCSPPDVFAHRAAGRGAPGDAIPTRCKRTGQKIILAGVRDRPLASYFTSWRPSVGMLL